MSVTARRLRSFCLATFIGAAGASVACGGDARSPAQAPRGATPAKREARADETEFSALKAETSKTLKSGARIDVPAGWWLRDLADGVAFQDPDRELTITLLELDAESTEAASTMALEKLGRAAPAKLARDDREEGRDGWDETAEKEWETPPSEERIFALNLRRKGKRTWAALLEGKTTAFSRRGAQVQQIVLGLEVPGVTVEDLSGKPALSLEGERLATLEAFIETARDKARVPGAAVAVVQGGKIVLAKGFGVRERGKKDPVTARTRFMIGSVTKSLSTLLIASLVDSGALTWSTRIKELLPAFETGDLKLTGELSVEHTFCACTGVPRRDLDLAFEYSARGPDDALTAFVGVKPTTAMGETFQYSNQMTALGGFLAARVAEPNKPLGAAYAAAMKARVFAPMGMNDTTASFDEGTKGPLASPHRYNRASSADEPLVLPLAMERFVEPVAPAGAVFSTVSDMARYALVELARGKTPEGARVFSEANLLERRKSRVRVGPRGGYGLGLATSVLRGLPVVTHDGGTFGYVARLALFPDKDLGLVVLTNTTSAGPTFIDAVTQRLIEIVFEAKEQAAKELDEGLEKRRTQWAQIYDEISAPAPSDVVARVVGTWKSDRLGTFTFTSKKDGLRVDVGEWSSRLGYRKSGDGTAQLFFLDPPVVALPMTLEGDAIILSIGQESHRLTKK